MTDDPADAHLAAQYEAYPYPRRDPREEARRLVVGSPGHLREIDYWVFAARRPRHLPLRALFAGGGSGDGTLMLAQQLAWANRPGEVVWLDRSTAALNVAQSRASARGLANIRFVQASLLDLPRLDLGLFDYIDCCGVLHHLPDPAEGLAALRGALAPDGGLGLMVYAPHGRTGVYMLQEALRLLAPIDEPPPRRLEVAQRVMRHLPESAWLHRNTNFADHITGGDAGLYDLLLNPRDRAYTVDALAALLADAGLEIIQLMEPLRYNPATWLPDPKLRARAAQLSPISQAALAEHLTGNMSTHIAYCRLAGSAPPPPDPLADTAIPVAREMSAPDLAAQIRPDHTIAFLFDGLRAPLALPALAAPILRLVDGTRSVADLRAALAGRTDAAGFARAWGGTWAALNAVNRLLLAPPA